MAVMKKNRLFGLDVFGMVLMLAMRYVFPTMLLLNSLGREYELLKKFQRTFFMCYLMFYTSRTISMILIVFEFK